MTYQVLARKWRPKNFSELVGQDTTKRILNNALSAKKIHQGYIFTGTRGVGKTTIARILAKCLNCEVAGVSAEPCCNCESCKTIDKGSFADLIEVDGASRTKVDETRELIESAQFAPTHGRYKVYLIDEAHMLSSASFNALLKTLEEPPQHSKFILATTDPKKIPATIVSRCLQFNMKNLLPQQIVDQLRKVFGVEKIDFDEQSLWLIAHSAEGSMRDALSISEQAIAYTNGKLSSDELTSMLGILGSDYTLAVLELIQQQDAQKLFELTAKMAASAFDQQKFIDDLLALIHRVAISQASGSISTSSLYSGQTIHKLASSMAPEELQIYWQIGLQGRQELSWAQDSMTALEMLLLRMIAFKPSAELPKPTYVQLPEPPEDSVAPPDTELKTEDAPAEPTEATTETTSEPEDKSDSQASAPVEAEANEAEAANSELSQDETASNHDDTTVKANTVPAKPEVAKTETSSKAKKRHKLVQPEEIVDNPELWQSTLRTLNLNHGVIGALETCSVQSVVGGQWELTCSDRMATVTIQARQEEIDQALTQAFRQTVTTHISVKRIDQRRSAQTSAQVKERLSKQLNFQPLTAKPISI